MFTFLVTAKKEQCKKKKIKYGKIFVFFFKAPLSPGVRPAKKMHTQQQHLTSPSPLSEQRGTCHPPAQRRSMARFPAEPADSTRGGLRFHE
ncbi:hypothetical protein AB205_0193490 [Aquarana catesbeiana]|uniref:Uncharacterized protein n=1 Tax=Aquarana catesbeiana TaxID=8400 RepID=A0A2G9RWP9_AQUCT|nr:hypothetical protein AB205_0193490 [Aquarana catesbeiana]